MYTLGDIPRKGARIHARKEAVVFDGLRVTYALFEDRVNRLANALLGVGCRKGERIAILSENSHKYLEVYFAAAKAGLVVVPLNFRLSQNEIVQIMNDCGPVLFLAGDGYESLASEIKALTPTVRGWIALDGIPPSGFSSYEELVRNASSEDPRVPVDENDLAMLVYTGGTTGLPKGVMLSHRNILTSILGLMAGFHFGEHDATCFLLPLFHVSFWPAFCCLLGGGKVVVLRRPELEVILKAIQDEKCTHVNAVPTLYNWLIDFPKLEEFDLSSLRLITYSGSPMPLELLKRCIRKFGNILAQGYGLTEAAPLVSYLMPDEHVLEGPRSRLLSSAGKEGAVVEVRVVDENGRPLPLEGLGEITVRGANVMIGYWNNEILTGEKLRDGWLHTGDMGMLDEEGYLYLVDRKADMIITGGENVYPTETENILYRHPAVHECAVVSAPDERWGERVQAVVVLRPGERATERELIDFCKKELAGYKCPKKVVFLDQLPKSTVGKILRKELKKEFWKGKEKSIG